MLRFTTGDMFEASADIRVNTVNCVGIMGTGVALAFKNRFPEMFREYRQECELKRLRPGKLHIWRRIGREWIINFPTKRHWREKSRYEDIELGLVALRDYLAKQGEIRVTLPALGCGHGGLDWNRVSAMIRDYLQDLEAEILVFAPEDSQVIGQQQAQNSTAEFSLLKIDDERFPQILKLLGLQKIYFQGDSNLLNIPSVAVILSSKPTAQEQTVALNCVVELANPSIMFNFVLNSSASTKLATTALENGAQVTAWVPQGLSRYQLPKVLRAAYESGNLLLESVAKPNQGWNPQLAKQTTLALLLTSKLKLITDPEPKWLVHVNEEVRDAMRALTFYIRYQTTDPSLNELLSGLSARPIGRRGDNGKPNVAPVLEALEQSILPETIHETLLLKKDKATTHHPLQTSQQLVNQTITRQPQDKMTAYPKRLIEVDLPIKRISEHASREKSIHHGHISTLHIWWARRPLAACRAVICAALWIDPADPLCPQDFRERAAALITNFARKASLSKELTRYCSSDIWHKWNLLAKPENKFILSNEVHLSWLRNALLDFIAEFANWNNSTQKDYLETARLLTQAAHEALGGERGTPPLVVDPFAGGGAIPLEALRVGADAFASDLNPVAVLLNKVALEYIPKYGQRLADEVRQWGQWIKQEAEKELIEFYPKDIDGATPIAYLWARTIKCEGPFCGFELPLIRNMQITRDGRKWHFVYNETNNAVHVSVKEGSVSPDRPTVSGGSVTCPRQVCGYTTPAKAVRNQLNQQRGGAGNAMLLAVYVSSSSGRFFRNPIEKDSMAAANARRFLDFGALPKELINPIRPYKNTRGLSAVTRIGIKSYADLYTPRQALIIQTLQKILLGIRNEGWEREFKNAVLSTLSCAVSRLVFQNCSLSRWHSGRSTIEGAFGKQALQIVWDFAESNPLSDGPANWDGAIEWVLKVIEANKSIEKVATVAQIPAQKQWLPDDLADMLVTDPPYFAAIPYADLSNVFYVWERTFLKILHPDLFVDGLVDQADEIIVTNANVSRNGKPKTPDFYREEMTKSLENARRVVAPKGIGVIVFADSSTTSWESILGAVIDGGWIITGSWPIDTELQTRTQAAGAASLQSSIHLVCRPRENPDGSVREEVIGDWRDVLQELPRRMHDWMPRLAKEGVVGADAIFACLGPALEIFSRYSRVEKASGEQVLLKEYLEYVWAAVAKEALNMIFSGADTTGFEEDARLTAMWLWTLSTEQSEANGKVDDDENEDDDDESSKAKKKKTVGYVLEYDAARKIAQGLGAHLEKLTSLLEVKGETARLLSVGERTRYLFGKDETQAEKSKKKSRQLKLGFLEELTDAEAEMGKAPSLGMTTLDRVHQAMILFAAGRAEAMKRFLIEEGAGNDSRFWRLAQALVALYPSSSNEKRWVEGVLARKKSLGF